MPTFRLKRAAGSSPVKLFARRSRDLILVGRTVSGKGPERLLYATCSILKYGELLRSEPKLVDVVYSPAYI